MTRTLEQGTVTNDGGSLPENFSEHKSIERIIVVEGVSSVEDFAFGFCENNFCANLQKIFSWQIDGDTLKIFGAKKFADHEKFRGRFFYEQD